MKKFAWLFAVVLMATLTTLPNRAIATTGWWDFHYGDCSNGSRWCTLDVYDACGCLQATVSVDCSGACTITKGSCPPCDAKTIILGNPNIGGVELADSFYCAIPGTTGHSYDLVGYHRGSAIFSIYDSLAYSTDTSDNYITHVTILGSYRIAMGRPDNNDQPNKISGTTALRSITLNHDTLYSSPNAAKGKTGVPTSTIGVISGRRGPSSQITATTPSGTITLSPGSDLVSNFNVSQNNALITAKFTLAESSEVRIQLCDVLGRSVYHSEQTMNAGDCSLEISKSNSIEDGIYFVRLEAGGVTQTKKIIVAR